MTRFAGERCTLSVVHLHLTIRTVYLFLQLNSIFVSFMLTNSLGSCFSLKLGTMSTLNLSSFNYASTDADLLRTMLISVQKRCLDI